LDFMAEKIEDFFRVNLLKTWVQILKVWIERCLIYTYKNVNLGLIVEVDMYQILLKLFRDEPLKLSISYKYINRIDNA
jgi:hypothetical protein